MVSTLRSTTIRGLRGTALPCRSTTLTPDGHTLLEFEGAGQKTEVYVDTDLVGTHVGGYDRWWVDITHCGQGLLPLAVRCDNSRDVQMIPSDMSDFCLYGGLYRMACHWSICRMIILLMCRSMSMAIPSV